jgi:hypothetical protein
VSYGQWRDESEAVRVRDSGLEPVFQSGHVFAILLGTLKSTCPLKNTATKTRSPHKPDDPKPLGR